MGQGVCATWVHVRPTQTLLGCPTCPALASVMLPKGCTVEGWQKGSWGACRAPPFGGGRNDLRTQGKGNHVGHVGSFTLSTRRLPATPWGLSTTVAAV
jgi:hypothetical protein